MSRVTTVDTRSAAPAQLAAVPGDAAVGAAGTGRAAADEKLALQKDNIAQLSEISRNSQTTFLALIVACVYSILTIATTTDATLLSNSNATPLPIIQANVPIVGFYYVAPAILTVLFVYFHLYLEHFWRGIAPLPLHHSDGRGLDDYVYPWLISCAVIRGEISALADSHPWAAKLEAWLSLLLGWGMVPIVLLFYWGRYAAAHDLLGTALHIGWVLLAAGFAMHYLFTAKNALQHIERNSKVVAAGGSALPAPSLRLSRPQTRLLVAVLLGVFAALCYLSGAAFRSLSDRDCARLEKGADCTVYAPGRAIWQGFGVAPYSVVREGRFIPKPAAWQQLVGEPEALRNFLEGQRGLVLVGRDLRNMDAANAFMPGSVFMSASLEFAELTHAVMTGSRFDKVTLRGANLTDAVLHHVEIADSRFDDVRAEAVHFDHADFKAADSDRRTHLSGNFSNATFDHAKGDQLQISGGDGGDQTSLRGASLRGVRFNFATFNRVDLGTATIEEASLANSSFVDTDFSGATIRSSFMTLSEFTRCRFIATVIQDAVFEGARFVDSEFDSVTSSTAEPQAGVDPPPRPERKSIEAFQAVLASFDAKTRIRNLHFKLAELRFARFNGTTLENTRFSNSDLARASFNNVDLSSVEFDGVDLSGADLSTARKLSPALLEGACGNADTRLPPGHTLKVCPSGGAR